MYCPNCGSDNNKNQNYCRFCGLNLIDISKSLKLQLSFGEKGVALKKSDKFKRTINQISDALIVMFFVGLILFVLIDRSYISAFFKYSAGTFFFFQIVKWLVSYFPGENVKNEKNLKTVEPETFEPKDTNKLLEEKPFEPIGSIVENSTELLHVENKTRKFE